MLENKSNKKQRMPKRMKTEKSMCLKVEYLQYQFNYLTPYVTILKKFIYPGILYLFPNICK